MKVRIRKYQLCDRPHIIECMERFGDYLATLDRLERTRRMPGYGEWFTNNMLQEVRKNNGLIYVVESEGRVVGFIAGIIIRQSEESLLECIPSKDGRVIELFVEEEFRDQGIGTRLMEKIEDYFRQNSCDVSKVEVFAPNIRAHSFYGKLGYRERDINMMKPL